MEVKLRTRISSISKTDVRCQDGWFDREMPSTSPTNAISSPDERMSISLIRFHCISTLDWSIENRLCFNSDFSPIESIRRSTLSTRDRMNAKRFDVVNEFSRLVETAADLFSSLDEATVVTCVKIDSLMQYEVTAKYPRNAFYLHLQLQLNNDDLYSNLEFFIQHFDYHRYRHSSFLLQRK